MGTQIAETRPNRYTSGWTYGNFAFNGGFTQRNPQTSDSTSGNSIASFLLGDVASGNTDINAQSSAVFRTYGLYIQDNFTVTSKLTLNLGLRWDLQTPITERWDRLVTGFDPNAKYALGSATASRRPDLRQTGRPLHLERQVHRLPAPLRTGLPDSAAPGHARVLRHELPAARRHRRIGHRSPERLLPQHSVRLHQWRRRQFLHPQPARQLHLGQSVPVGSPAALRQHAGSPHLRRPGHHL